MIVVKERAARRLEDPLLRNMFAARKSVFVDLLGWELPVLAGGYELDQFDDERACYLILADPLGQHLASARLLETVRPHILDSLFADLCAEAPPSGPDVREITRFCLGRGQPASQRRWIRNRLVTALVEHALARGVRTYTGVAEMGWLQQILAFGWRCRMLGEPRARGGKLLGALRIDIDESTPFQLVRNGVWSSPPARADHPLIAA